MPVHKRIALVAHDDRKLELLEWARWNRAGLSADFMNSLPLLTGAYSRRLPDYSDALDRAPDQGPPTGNAPRAG